MIDFTKILQKDFVLPYKPAEFRISMLPYCPILHLLHLQEQPPEIKDYQSQFYFGIGHSVHATLQFFLANHPTFGRQAWGIWKCCDPTCTVYQQSVVEPSFRPSCHPQCSHAEQGWKYQEVSLYYQGLSGHVDFLYRDKKKKWHLVDFKTTSSWLFSPRGQDSPYHPYKKHILQVEDYAVLLRWIFKIKIHQWHIIYVGREKFEHEHPTKFLRTFTHQLTPDDYRMRATRLREEIFGNKLVKKYQCFPQDRNLKALVAARPCFSRKDYLEKMSLGYFKDDACPLFSQGSCGHAKNVKIVKMLREKIVERRKK